MLSDAWTCWVEVQLWVGAIASSPIGRLIAGVCVLLSCAMSKGNAVKKRPRQTTRYGLITWCPEGIGPVTTVPGSKRDVDRRWLRVAWLQCVDGRGDALDPIC